MDAVLHRRQAAAIAQAAPAFAEEVTHQTEVAAEVFVGVELGEIPARRVGVDAVLEGSVVAHLTRQGAEQVADALLLLHIDIEVAHHHDSALSADALLAAAEFARGHIALEDVDAVLLIERHASHLVEADHVELADQAALAVAVVDEHLGDGGLAARDQVRVRRNLLEQMALTCAAWAQLHQVEVALHKGSHAQQHHHLGPLIEGGWLNADRADQEVAPLICGESSSALGQYPQHVGVGHLDRPQPGDAERPAVALLGDHRVVFERHLGVETIGEHALVGTH